MSGPPAEACTPRGPRARCELGAGARATGAIIWSGFLAAAVATMLCFAFLDPLSLASGDPPSWWTSQLRVYAIGFFFFWLVGLLAATLCWQLVRPPGATGSR